MRDHINCASSGDMIVEVALIFLEVAHEFVWWQRRAIETSVIFPDWEESWSKAASSA